ncbi:DUF2239 family protein [Anaerosoma tenue]|uniref:DUF2239 family protein n=1 Tax=Anaerosoma tenue TaxID=2933588 RepID=UPI002260D588|nr:DUF2239 family protein [Anaerosoma tenue]MCK8115738.1 DUF2239 family protein [Anaerosoma tenue]
MNAEMDAPSLVLFAGTQMITSGGRKEIAEGVAELQAHGDARPLLVFDSVTGEQVDIDLRENPASDDAAVDEAPVRGPGRPRLGVVSREVTLLPRHWEWLSAQPSGASAALRRLVDQARRQNESADRIRRSQEAAFRFMSAMAGNEPGFEEACRSLFAGDERGFRSHVEGWPDDVAGLATKLAADAFSAGSAG